MASDTAAAVKKEYAKKEADLDRRLSKVKEKEGHYNRLVSNENNRINNLAEQKISAKKRSLQNQYKEISENLELEYQQRVGKAKDDYTAKKSGLYFLTFGAIAYSFLVTILTAFQSDRFLEDLGSFFLYIGNAITGLYASGIALGTTAWSLHERIPYKVVNVLLPGLLAIAGFLAVFGGILALFGFVIYKVGKFYHKEFADEMSLGMVLVTLALLVWFADYLTFIRIILVVVFLLVHGVYILIRMIVKSNASV